MSDRVRTSVATVSLGGSLEDKLTAIAAAGFDGFEVFEPDFVAGPFAPEELAVRAADLGLAIDLYQPFRDLDSVDPDQFARNLVRAQRKFDLMARMGCDTLLVCSSPLPKAVRDDAQLAEQLHSLADLAQARGIRIAYEALAWGTHVDTYRHAWRIVADVDHPALGTCLDSFHILSRGDDPSGIRDIPGDKIFFLQLADAPRLSMDVLSWSRHHRNFPGQGNFDLAAFGAHVQATGYAGPWSLEIFNDTFRQTATGRTAVDAHRSLLYLQEEVAKLATPTGDRRRSRAVHAARAPRGGGRGFAAPRGRPGQGDRTAERARHIGFPFRGPPPRSGPAAVSAGPASDRRRRLPGHGVDPSGGAGAAGAHPDRGPRTATTSNGPVARRRSRCRRTRSSYPVPRPAPTATPTCSGSR